MDLNKLTIKSQEALARAQQADGVGLVVRGQGVVAQGCAGELRVSWSGTGGRR